MTPHTKHISRHRLDGEVVDVIRSARRRKTLEARRRNGRMQLLIPMGTSDEELLKAGNRLIKKLHSREERRSNMSNADLRQRADYLARTWLHGEVQASSVDWSESQERVWGNCRPGSKHIRISTAVLGMPQWVIDGLLIHELAHLKHRGHGSEFHQFTYNYPKMKEAMAFLDGASWAKHGRSVAPNAPEDMPFPKPSAKGDGFFNPDLLGS